MKYVLISVPEKTSSETKTNNQTKNPKELKNKWTGHGGTKMLNVCKIQDSVYCLVLEFKYCILLLEWKIPRFGMKASKLNAQKSESKKKKKYSFFWDRYVPMHCVLNHTYVCVLLILCSFWLLCTQQWSKFCALGASIGWKHDLITKLSSINFQILNITSVVLIKTKVFVLKIEIFFSTVFCVLLKWLSSGVNQTLVVHCIHVCSFIMFECVRWDCSAQYCAHCRGFVDLTFSLKLVIWTSPLISCYIICSNSLKCLYFVVLKTWHGHPFKHSCI